MRREGKGKKEEEKIPFRSGKNKSKDIRSKYQQKAAL